MKTYHKLIATSLVAIGLLSFASCTDGLDIKPTAELEDEFFDSELRLQEGVGACYASLANMYGALLNDGGGIHEILLLPGDDIANQEDRKSVV